jgi:tRNA(adenine34) deaminase
MPGARRIGPCQSPGPVSEIAISGANPSDESWMREALNEADLAPLHGDVPVGCVVVGPEGTELARDHNRREQNADPTAHAELLALRGAAAKLGHWRLEHCTVFATLEPCPMCAGALVNARVGRVVFGAYDPKAGALTSLFELGRDARLNHRFEVVPGVLAEEGAARLKAFFARLRVAPT